jgi:histidinol-phosphate aminotransferase
VKTVVEMRGYVAQQMARMTRFRMVPNSRANFFLTEILDPALDSDIVFEELLKRGVIVKNGNHIEGLGSRYLRVDLNLKVHMDRFLNALNDLPVH